ncbi:MAG TPA: PQQ-dependent sugar dehydrogenase [Candidatus Udaeobacter sp.]|nr:PQQ-dependent sugar dehydrogenase [Candidatus Udaeobacter sp.]
MKTFRCLLVLVAIACGPTANQLASSVPDDLKIDVVARHLNTPWAIDFAPDGRIFITERPGRIRIIERGQLQAETWAGVDVAAVGEAGLMGLALHPQFDKNRYVYLAYTYRAADGKLQNRLVRFREDPKSRKGLVDQVLIDGVAGANNHDGGRLKFGPDGKLYWTTGDAQTTKLAQNLSSLNGKILRINADGSIPTDNPFPNSYVYSYGHRNPQGLAWQAGTKGLYSTEHGPSGFQGCCRDEINYIEAGKNYGWPAIRGDDAREGMVSPVIHAGTSETWAPAGATFVTRGPWSSSLLFTGLRGQTLYRATLDPNNPRKVTQLERLLYRQFGRLRDIVEGPDGSLYLLTSNRDGRGSPKDDDDRVIQLSFK